MHMHGNRIFIMHLGTLTICKHKLMSVCFAFSRVSVPLIKYSFFVVTHAKIVMKTDSQLEMKLKKRNESMGFTEIQISICIYASSSTYMVLLRYVLYQIPSSAVKTLSNLSRYQMNPILQSQEPSRASNGGVYFKHFGENWPSYNGTALYVINYIAWDFVALRYSIQCIMQKNLIRGVNYKWATVYMRVRWNIWLDLLKAHCRIYASVE